jgi:hypothetical protein
MLALVFVMFGLNRFYDAVAGAISGNRSWRKRLYFSAFMLGCTVLIFEQCNHMGYELDKSTQRLFLNQIQSPPRDCKVFYVKKIDSPEKPVWSYQTDALMISMKLNLPTLNGYSGLEPKGWTLHDPAGILYGQSIGRWLRANKIHADDVCSLDIHKGTFAHITLAELADDSDKVLYDNFQTIRKAVERYVAQKHTLIGLRPASLFAGPGLSSEITGGFPLLDDSNNWTLNGYWLGVWGDDSYAVGFAPVDVQTAQTLYASYEQAAQKIYFPYPKVCSSPPSDSLNESGQILIVFDKP